MFALRPSYALALVPGAGQARLNALREDSFLLLSQFGVDSNDNVGHEALVAAVVQALQAAEVTEHHRYLLRVQVVNRVPDVFGVPSDAAHLRDHHLVKPSISRALEQSFEVVTFLISLGTSNLGGDGLCDLEVLLLAELV